MNITTAKKCPTRDAATATLRKLGIAKQDYDDYICKKDDIFYTDVIGAEKAMKDEKPVTPTDVREVDHSAANAVVAEAMLKSTKKSVAAKPEAVDHSASNAGIAKALAADKVPAKKTAAKPLPKATQEKMAAAAKVVMASIKKESKKVVKEGTPPVAAQKGQKETVAEATRRMLLAGKSNIEIWEELLKQFPSIDEKKKQFPAWYRYDMKKKGQLA